MDSAKHIDPSDMRRVYVYGIPVRVIHWLNVLAILTLAATGLIISHPPAFLVSTEAYANYWFGTVRFIHFTAAYVFFFGFIFRIYLLFAGNRFETWDNFFPFSKRAWKELWKVIKHDVLFTDLKPLISIGHNALAGFSYLMLFVIYILEIGTGFALYAQMSDSLIAKSFAWIVPLLGSDAAVRNWHHIFMWLFIIFAIIHVYLVLYHDYVEGRGELSSMTGGWKFIEKEVIDKHEYTDYKK